MRVKAKIIKQQEQVRYFLLSKKEGYTDRFFDPRPRTDRIYMRNSVKRMIYCVI